VDGVRSAGEGLEQAASQNYDLVLLDLTLPDQSGIDMLRMLRMRNDTPVLVLSALWDIDAKLTALAVGADDYVTKPFHRDELVARGSTVGDVPGRNRTGRAKRQ
jgi:two-component system cell cycle response regulator CtrA